MIKQVQFFGKTASGTFVQPLFGSHWGFEKVAGAHPFSNWATGDELAGYIKGISSEDRKKYCYVLVNALGAGEYFGSNINADYFPWNSLSHEGDDYGYKTFHRAHAFQHHKNKDPNRAFGIPVLSVLNHPMKRVELIIRLDREKARVEGADGIITRVDQGDFPDVSMGCKVPFDVCSICGNKSKVEEDYCEHFRPPPELSYLYGPNKILADGRKVFVYNYTPRFFDISFVFIGADKTAKVMAKLASAQGQLCLGDVCTIDRSSAEVSRIVDSSGIPYTYELTSREKTASASGDCGCGGDCCDEKNINAMFGVTKESSHQKIGEIIKTVPAGTLAMKSLPALEGSEPSLSKDTLEALAKKDVGTAASTSGLMGIVLKPSEFQRIVLIRMGEKGLADELDEDHSVFRQVSDINTSLDVDKDRFDADLMRILLSVLKERTAFGPGLPLRMIKSSAKKPLATAKRVSDPLLDKISAAYNGYRRNLLEKISQAQEVVMSDPQLREAVLGYNLSSVFTKTASVGILTPESAVYIAGAHLQDRSLLSEDTVEGFSTDQ